MFKKPTLRILGNLSTTGDGVFQALNDDPQMQLLPSAGDRNSGLKRGSYYLFVNIRTFEGKILRPTLYLDFGGGMSEAQGSKFVAKRIDGDRWFFHFSARRNIKLLRFDPSESPCRFSVEDIVLVSSTKLHCAKVKAALKDLIHQFLPSYQSQTGRTSQSETFDISNLANMSMNGRNEHQDLDQQRLKLFESEYNSRVYTSKDGRHYYEYAGLATDPLGNVSKNVKSIAFYLPQMHPIPENDAWWGRGFTEWANVSKAVPRFSGHYQPRLPGELGFYDLRCVETMRRQVELANIYGLSAFCFYYYWFSGHRLLERPLDMFLSNQDLQLDFCVCWANENWTRRWDGLESDILISQKHSEQDSEAVFNDWLRYFQDKRYIKVDGKPLLLIYRPDLIPDFERTTRTWREMARNAGYRGLHIVAANAFGNQELSVAGLDGLYEFPPHNVRVPHVDASLTWFEGNHKTHAFSYGDAVQFAETQHESAADEPVTIHPGALVGWDTEARKPGRGDVMVGSNPTLFRRWLSSAYRKALRSGPNAPKLVFINAWNEWAEGAYLEPDRRHGYGYLTALRSVVREFGLESSTLKSYCDSHNATSQDPKSKAIILHLFYADLIDEFADRIEAAQRIIDADIILTVPELWTLQELEEAVHKLAPRKVFVASNVGRDVYPFILACRNVVKDGYTHVCKIHSKKSTHRVDGAAWRNDLVAGLLSNDALALLERTYFPDSTYSLAAPANSFLPLGNNEYIAGNRIHYDALVQMFGIGPYDDREFVAGTMFWCRFDALTPIFDCALSDVDFGVDLGQVDGTLAHAFERVFAMVSSQQGGNLYKIDTSFEFNIKRPI
ncbi:lipopolysaccharide biosynthesis protein [Ensifer adhaerens]|uniref:Lipopolysaccharide biosynthesis protein n=1 Tax=Ensifer adhaerens TaxID=106592 RepID=A0ACC5SU17_ENSAD|nr:glycoside hydrolase family 99-like domain-containing protein [Ensifer adhaerens]MBP1872371.1 lipopolysaccharide biosynthesis protein [Ensifer adhaerens]